MKRSFAIDRNGRALKAVLMALTAGLMAGCAVCAVTGAAGFEVGALAVYLLSLSAALAVEAIRSKSSLTIPGIIVLVGGVAVLLLTGLAPMRALVNAIREDRGLAESLTVGHTAGARAFAFLCAFALSALFDLTLQERESVSFVLLVFIAVVLISLTIVQTVSLWTAVPGFVGAVIAYALMADQRSEGVRIPFIISALCIVLVAMLLVPSGRVTWAPLEQVAEKIRTVREDYLHFTEERVPFRINEKGFDHGEMVGGVPTVVLGGDADPSNDAVMRVKTDHDILLHGTIERSYTGYSWTDETPKSRYLYYDFSHRQARRAALGRGEYADEDAFEECEVEVEMLADGSSTIFVPSQLKTFSMELSDAVYYNSAGEMFLTRTVEKGDSYALTGYVPKSDEALLLAAAQSQSAQDPQYDAAREGYCALPDGIDSDVYGLTVSLINGKNSAAERALAIRDYLRSNYAYTLRGGYLPQGKDFVSWFLLETKKGYCSYFASAMTVMCRIAGIPARYVEGYMVKATPGGETTVTGQNAHAWTEVYLSGLGWIALDATAPGGSMSSNDAGSSDAPNPNSGRDMNSEGNSGNDFENEGDGDIGDNALDDDGTRGDDDPLEDPPAGEDAPPQEDEDPGEPEEEDGDEDDEEDPGDGEGDASDAGTDGSGGGSSSPVLWLILAALALAAAGYFGVREAKKRLRASDPLRLCPASGKHAAQSVTILYRALLTLLLQFGFAPTGGETPMDFAQRVSQTFFNEDYVKFVEDYTLFVYAGKEPSKQSVQRGRRAYSAFLLGLNRREKLRYAIHRILRGLGSFEHIP